MPWHFLYFLPLPHGHGSLRPTLGSSRRMVLMTSSPPARAGVGLADADGEGGAAALCRAIPPNAGLASAPGLLVIIGAARRGAGRNASSLATGRSQKR